MTKDVKKYYHIAVKKNNGYVFITRVENATKQFWWNVDETPLVFTKTHAEEMLWALRVNGYDCFIVETFYAPITTQFLAELVPAYGIITTEFFQNNEKLYWNDIFEERFCSIGDAIKFIEEDAADYCLNLNSEFKENVNPFKFEEDASEKFDYIIRFWDGTDDDQDRDYRPVLGYKIVPLTWSSCTILTENYDRVHIELEKHSSEEGCDRKVEYKATNVNKGSVTEKGEINYSSPECVYFDAREAIDAVLECLYDKKVSYVFA